MKTTQGSILLESARRFETPLDCT
uniref:Uncharacterized protein n=1 Tax=Rhizophora mucronata TaxID=61149 RepID=A0A2P2QDN4_RHIMU